MAEPDLPVSGAGRVWTRAHRAPGLSGTVLFATAAGRDCADAGTGRRQARSHAAACCAEAVASGNPSGKRNLHRQARRHAVWTGSTLRAEISGLGRLESDSGTVCDSV